MGTWGTGKVRVLADRSAVRTVYEVRPLDEYGDALDVLTFDTLREAREEFAGAALDGEFGRVLERHKSYDRIGQPDVYVTLAYRGEVAR